MRAGGFTVQQTLTSEAASVLKNSLTLARRRGHAQVTPLHVAATLLSSRTSVLRRACVKSHPHSTSHPLQCRALELCFNVALNRLPTTPGPMLHGQPSLSNALIAALKRAQAHQRRGCIEQQQQQPLLAIKVELEQLIISILDDPSVSRVMREAGFSSTSVKNNLEACSPSSVFQCYSSSNGVFPPSPTETHREIINHSSFWQTHFLNCSSDQNPLLFSTPKKHLGTLFNDSVNEKEDDFRLILEVFSRKSRRNTVVVGDCLATTEGLVTELMRRVEKGELVPGELKSTIFIKFQFSSVSLRFMKREEVEIKIADLRKKVGSLTSNGGGAIIYAGDLKWTVEDNINEISGYNPADHLVSEIGRLISDYSISNSKVWLMATANYQTYMRCQMKQPSLEIQWTLQAVSVPSGGLGLSLHASSGINARMTTSENKPQMLVEAKPFTSMEEDPDKLTCCAECTSNFERDAVFLKSGQQKSSSLLLSSYDNKDMDKSTAHLPSWLQPRRTDSNHKYGFQYGLVELRRKWNRLCHSLHHPRSNQTQSTTSLFNNQKNSPSTASYPWWTNKPQLNQNNTFSDSNSISFADSASKPTYNSNFLAQLGSQQSCSIDFALGNRTPKHHPTELSLDSLKNIENKDMKITLALGNSLFNDSATPSLLGQKKDLCKLLQENVPWQSEVVPSIADAVLSSGSNKKNGNWLLIQGSDWIGKRRLTRAITQALCGSTHHLVQMNMRRENEASPCSKILIEGLRNHDKCFVLIEEIDFASTHFIKFLEDGFKRSRFEEGSNGREVGLAGATFLLTTSSSTGYKEDSLINMKLLVEEKTHTLGVSDSNRKRKAEWDLSNKKKCSRIDDEEDASSNKKVFSRQSSSNTLDLNVEAEEEEEEDVDGENTGEFTPSDLTQETLMLDPKIPHGFFETIENRFVLDQNSVFFEEMTRIFSSKMEGSFEEVFGCERRDWFSVDHEVLEGIVVSSGSFLASLFEKWLKDVFQTSLLDVKKGGKEVTVRLCFGGKIEKCVLEVGYMGSNLPTTIQLGCKE